MIALSGITLYKSFSIPITLCKGFPSLLLYSEYNSLSSESVTTNLVVVEPASIPIKQSPLKFAKSPLGTLSLLCLDLNSSYSESVTKSGLIGLDVLS